VAIDVPEQSYNEDLVSDRERRNLCWQNQGCRDVPIARSRWSRSKGGVAGLTFPVQWLNLDCRDPRSTSVL
jgi:hypothetical protein